MPIYAICDNGTINKGLLMSKAGYMLASDFLFACIQQLTNFFSFDIIKESAIKISYSKIILFIINTLIRIQC